MKNILLPSVLTILASCGSNKPVETPVVTTEVYPRSFHSVSGMNIPYNRLNTLRSPEGVKAWHIGRFKDPANENMMYEATVAYEVIEKSHWITDYNPSTPPFAGKYAYEKHYERNAEVLSDEYYAKNELLRSKYQSYVKQLKLLRERHKQVDHIVRTLKNANSQNVEMASQLQFAKKREAALKANIHSLESQKTQLLKHIESQETSTTRSKYDRR